MKQIVGEVRLRCDRLDFFPVYCWGNTIFVEFREVYVNGEKRNEPRKRVVDNLRKWREAS